MDFDEEIAAAAITDPDVSLIRLALDAIRAVAADDRWFSSWFSDVDGESSRHTVAVIAGVLADHAEAAS